MWHGYYCLPLIRCYKKDEFKQRFTDFQTELGKNTKNPSVKGWKSQQFPYSKDKEEKLKEHAIVRLFSRSK